LFLLVHQLDSAEPLFKLSLHLCITLEANQFTTPVLVYKTKYLLERQYSNHQFINFIHIYDMLRSLYKNTSLQAFLVQSVLLKLTIVT